MSYYDTNLDKNDANYVPLSPLSFLERTKNIYPNYEAIVYESRSYTWSEVYKRCVKFASALEKIGVKLEIQSQLWRLILQKYLKRITQYQWWVL
jgi:fatty-acyl-CoA synthase